MKLIVLVSEDKTNILKMNFKWKITLGTSNLYVAICFFFRLRVLNSILKEFLNDPINTKFSQLF